MTAKRIEKTSKKLLKKQRQLSLQDLTKQVQSKHPELEQTLISKTLSESSKFVIQDNVVTRSKKRKKKDKKSSSNNKRKASTPSIKDNDTNNREDEPSPKKSRPNPDNANNKQDKIVDIEEWRKEHNIVVSESSLPVWRSFDECQLDGRLISHCKRLYKEPTPIQAQTFGVANNFVGIAETGSGKSLAFLLPALSRLASNSSSRHGLRVLVLTPTRELAMQVHGVCHEFGSQVNINSCVVYGGVPKHTQVPSIRRSGVIVATPGRLKDFLQDQTVSLGKIETVILDEADRMLDMGFEKDVEYILDHTPATRRTVMFSATWPESIRELAGHYLQTYETVKIGTTDELSANPRVQQTIEVLDDRARESRLFALLQQLYTKETRILIFALYKKEAERLERTLQRQQYQCTSIHGNKSQTDRNRALEEFKNGTTPLLIATDVASRGLDIPNVQVVINFTFPLTIEDYVHRIGRTGRAGQSGTSITFFQPSDKGHAGALQNVLRSVNQDIPPELSKFGNTVKKKQHSLYGDFGPRGITKAPTRIKF